MDTVLRVAATYVFLMIALRILGKREFSQLTPLELVSLLIVPEIVSQGLVGEHSLVDSLTGVATLLVLVFATSLVSYRWKRADAAISGEPTVLVQDGRLRRRAMDETRVSADELEAEMRKAGLERLEDVKWAVLESGGNISFIPRPPATRVRGDPNRSLDA